MLGPTLPFLGMPRFGRFPYPPPSPLRIGLLGGFSSTFSYGKTLIWFLYHFSTAWHTIESNTYQIPIKSNSLNTAACWATTRNCGAVIHIHDSKNVLGTHWYSYAGGSGWGAAGRALISMGTERYVFYVFYDAVVCISFWIWLIIDPIFNGHLFCQLCHTYIN
jgi:hypothetical protein